MWPDFPTLKEHGLCEAPHCEAGGRGGAEECAEKRGSRASSFRTVQTSAVGREVMSGSVRERRR